MSPSTASESDFKCPSCGAQSVHAVGFDAGPLQCLDCAVTSIAPASLETPEGRARMAAALFRACIPTILSDVRASVRDGEPIEELGAMIIEPGMAKENGFPALIVTNRALLAERLGKFAHHLAPTGMANHIPVVALVWPLYASIKLEIPLAA